MEISMLEISCISHSKAYRAINTHTDGLKEGNIIMSLKRWNLGVKSISEIPKYPFYDVQIPNGKEVGSKNELWSGGSVEWQKSYYFTLSQLKQNNTFLYPAPLSRSLKWKAYPEDWHKSFFSAWKNHYTNNSLSNEHNCHSLLQQLAKVSLAISGTSIPNCNTVELRQNSITGCSGEHNTLYSSRNRSMHGTEQMKVGS